MCDKEPYSTYQEAMLALKGLIKRGIKKLKSYKCDDCGAYHLSSFSDNRKPIGLMGKYKPGSIKKKRKNQFKKIKVTKEEIEKGREKQPKVKLFGEIINLQNNKK